MSAWKSPLLYLGMLIIAAAAAALAAPLFVDWDSYRGRLEAYGSELTGRDVKIAGSIDARLFPWPVLKLRDVRVANPEGAATPDLFTAGEIVLRMQLAPLLSGHVEVEAIDVDRPVFGFERLRSDEWSWSLAPGAGRRFVDPERISVEAITLTNAAVVLADGRRGGSARLDVSSATLSAPSLSGPWRMHASAAYHGTEIELAMSTGKVRPDEPTTVSVTIDPKSGSGFSYAFDGEVGGSGEKPVRGRIKVTPTVAESEDDANLPASGWPAYTLRGELQADFDTIDLAKIEIAPTRSAEPGKFITGEASVRLGAAIDVKARLEAARLDVDSLANGKGSLRPLEELGALAGIVNQLPEGLAVSLDLAAASLVVGGEALESGRVRIEAGTGRVRVHDLSVALPGQSHIGFSGLFVADPGSPELSGELSLDAISLRDLAMWALPGNRRDISEVWSGARGRLKLAAKLDLSSGGVRLGNVVATLDDSQLSGGFGYRGGTDSELAIRLVANTLNLDRYAPEGLLSRGGRERRAEIGFGLVSASMGFDNFQLTMQADRMTLHGVEAEDIAVDIGANGDGIELRTVQLGDVGGARLDVAGLVRFPGEGVSGSINASIDAVDPQGLLRLLGLLDGSPKWAEALGPVNARLVAEATSLNKYTQASSSLTGTAGGVELSFDGRFDGEIAAWQDGHVKLDGEAKSGASRLMAALTGLELAGAANLPSSLKVSSSGSFSRGISASIESEILGTKLQFAGTASQGGSPIKVSGRGAVLAERAGDLLAALELPAGGLSPLAGVLSAESEIEFDGRSLGLIGLSGTAGGSSFFGDLKMTFAPARNISGKLTAGRLSLPWLLRAALMPASEADDPEGRFRPRLPDFAAADLTVAANRLEAVGPLSIENAAITLKLDAKGLAFDASGTGPAEAPASISLTARLDDTGATVAGSAASGIDLAQVFMDESGAPVIEGKGSFKLAFSGNGRTPAGLIAAAQASGDYELPRGTLRRVDPKAFGRDLALARRPSEIDQLIASSLRSGDVVFTGGSGKLTLAGGVLTASPLVIAGEGMTGEVRLLVEPVSASADIALTLSLLEPPGLPSFELAYAGPPAAMQPSSNTQELKSRLAVKVLQEGIDQLEEIQRQEQQLMREEEAFRKEQEQRREFERESLRRLNELKARKAIEARQPPKEEVSPTPAPPAPQPLERGALRQTDPAPLPAAEAAPAPITEANQAPAAEEAASEPVAVAEPGADVPKPRKKPPAAPARAEFSPSGPTVVIPRSLAPAPTTSTPAPSPTILPFLFSTEPPTPLTDFSSRASGRDK